MFKKLSLALFTSLACDLGEPIPDVAPPEVKPEPKITTVEAEWLKPDYEKLPWREFTFKLGSQDIKAQVYGFGTDYSIDLHGYPEGAKYEVGGQKGEVTSDIFETIRVDAKKYLANATINDEVMMVDPGFTLMLDEGYPYNEKLEIKLAPAPFANDLWLGLKEIAKGPILFGAEPDDPKKDDSLVLSWNEKSVQVIGHAGKLYEVDYIVLFAALPEKSTKKCGGYSDMSNLPAGSINLLLRETEVTIYDRRTGNVVEKKIFPPNASCPKTLYISADADSVYSELPYNAIEKWLKTKVKK